MWMVYVVFVVVGWGVVFLHQLQKSHLKELKREKDEVLHRILQRKIALQKALSQGQVLSVHQLECELEEDRLWLLYFDKQLQESWWL